MVTRRLTNAWATLGYAILEKEQRADVADWGTPAEVYDLVDVFTVTDGHWLPGETDKPIDIPVWASQDYMPWWAMQGLHYYGPIGSAISLFALVLNPDGTPRASKGMWFFTPHPERLVAPYKGLENWAQQNTGPQGMTHIELPDHTSGYAPGSHGVWCICPYGKSDVLYYAGRYNGWHISTMAVWRVRPYTPEPPPPPPEPGGDPVLAQEIAAMNTKLAAIMAWLHMPQG